MCINTGKLSWRTPVLSAKSQDTSSSLLLPHMATTLNILMIRGVFYGSGKDCLLFPCSLPSPVPGKGWTPSVFSLFPSCIRNFYRNTSVLLPSPSGRQQDGKLWKKQALWLPNQVHHAGKWQRAADTSPSPSSISTNSSAWFGLKKKAPIKAVNILNDFLYYFLWPFTVDTRLTRLCCLASFSLASSSSFWIFRTCLFILRIVECKISQTNNLKVIRHLVTVC